MGKIIDDAVLLDGCIFEAGIRKSGILRKDIARSISKSAPWLSSVIRGRAFPTRATAERIAKLLGMDPKYLILGDRSEFA